MDTPSPIEIRRVMSYLGKRKTPKKARAARLNGAKGGRPKKEQPATKKLACS